LLPARTSDDHVLIASGFISNAPQPPNPPALATAIARDAGQALAIGAIKTGTRMLNTSQNALARVIAGRPDIMVGVYTKNRRVVRPL
jgi:hypothetical protein